MDPSPHPLVAKLRSERRRLDMRQDVVAAAVGVTRGYLSQVETGQAMPRLDVVAAYAEAVGAHLTLTFDEIPPAVAS